MGEPLILGIDPGLSGAAALVNQAGELVDVFDLPIAGEGKLTRIDGANLSRLLRATRPTAAIIEAVAARPGQGVSSMFRFGMATGVVAGVIGSLEIPIRWVSPASWKRAMRLTADKEAARLRALETWPNHARDFARKHDHGRAEAALIAAYGLRERDAR